MRRFKLGDRVERMGALVPTWMKIGMITKVIPNKDGFDWATQYEVEFGQRTETFYQTELSLIDGADGRD